MRDAGRAASDAPRGEQEAELDGFGHGSSLYLHIGRQEGERASLQGLDLPKIALVKGQQPCRAIASGEHDDGEVGQAQVERRVPIVDGQSESVFLDRQRSDAEPLFGEILEEASCRAISTPSTDEVIDLGCDGRWDDQRSGLSLQHAANTAVVRVAGVPQGDQGSRINNECQSPNPRSSSSSDRSATDVPSPSQEPVSANERCAICCDS